MEKLQMAIQQKESQFITQVTAITEAEGSDRVKIALIYQAYVNCMVSINTLVSEAKLETPPAREAGLRQA